MQITLPARVPDRLIVPLGSQITATTDTDTGLLITLDHIDYDYSPFADPTAPPFDFLADVIRIAADRTITIDRSVTCISSPGRTSREKDT
ncbi:hypothetical protein ACN95_14695 [Gordonia sihwensis]|uniref:DUF7233 domain-containing protein n=1 Tax=Gordonia sihwensis TaxID=173559 RepID=UPI001C92D3D7|nr:hypothetical protein [Gordonia sihwensis]MBY4571266.1 hypothetical protein [Gordonia sihwensis]